MNNLTTFLANNYIWFLVIGIILIFALIGYIVDSKNIEQEKPKTMKYQKENKEQEKQPVPTPESTKTEEIKLDSATQPVSEKTELLDVSNIQESAATTEGAPIIKEDVKEESTFEK